MARLSAMVMPPDAGTTNSGTKPAVGQCGRGIQRTGDIRHIGDICGGKLATKTLTPGTNSYDVVPDDTDATAGPNGQPAFSYDSQCSSFTKYAGGDAAGEGFDGFSSKNGREN